MTILSPLLKKAFNSINPATGEVIATIGQASEDDVEKAILSAEKGFTEWSQMTAFERSRILLKAVKILRDRNDELAELEVIDCGKPLQEANCVDIQTGADVIEYFRWSSACNAGLSTRSRLRIRFLFLRESLWGFVLALVHGITQFKSPVGNQPLALLQETQWCLSHPRKRL